MGCVNRSSKEFKNLSARNNVDSNTLELITHKYWLEAGNETLFPTDIYIQAQLGNTHYQESGKSVRKLWEMRYNAPQEFKSLRELQVARKEASNFFPQSAIVHYRNAKGNYVLSVKRPVETVNYDKDNFFEELDNMGSIKDVKKLNLGIKERQTYTLDKVQELYQRFNEDRTSKVLADKVFGIAKDLGLEVTFGETLPFGTIGKYTNNNTITYKKSFLERDMMNSMKAPIILHEVLHALSMYALSNQTKNWKRSEDLEKFRTEMNSLYQDLKTNPILNGERGVVDVFEFVAELGNPVFRKRIQQIDELNKAKKSFWSRVLDAFKTLLGLHTSNTYYQRSMNALEKALDAFDIDTYMRYNGIKNPLRKGYNEKEWDFRTLSDDKLKDKVTKEVADNTINKDNQRLENKNNTQYEQSIKSAGQLFKDAYSIVKGGSSKDNEGFQGKTDAGKSIRERVHEESSKQQKELISWARKTDNIIVEPNDYFEEEYGESQSGSETTVWIANDNGRNVAIKSISLNHYATPEKLLDRILIHNTAFPSTAMGVLKVGVSDNGMSIIVKQPWIESGETIANQKEIEDYMLSQGFVHTKGQGVNAEYSKDNYVVTDIRPENVIKQPDGTLAVIDCFAMFKSEEAQRTSQSTLKDFISSLSGKELKDELALIEQESADYDLVNNIPEGNKHSGKAEPQDFTFADGTTVKAPFKPNAQQIDALNEMDRFMKSNETSMTLSGYAGTGKTSLMEMIAKKGQKQNRPVMFCATTNKAAAVLNDRVSKAGFKASTLNKVFGINVEVDSSKAYNARNLVNVLKDVDIMPGTTIIIDEASMINEENYKILNDIAKEHRLKIIYVGDEAQLAPVNEDKISKVFRNGEGKVIRLTQVERTDDNAILKEATAIRNGEPLSKISSFNSKGEGVAYIAPQHQDAINEVIDKYVKGLKQNPNYFRILAYTNKAVTAYNNQVRELLGYDSPIPHVGEPMTGYANWGYEWRSKSYRFINSESYKVTQVGRPTTVQTRLDNGTPVVMQAVPITLEDSLGNIDTFNFMDIKNNAQNRQSAMILANEKKKLWNEARRAYGREAKAEVYAKINAIDSFLFVNDNIEDNSHNLLQAKTIDFGYALTIHKSQGSTFTHVLMDDVDVSRASMSGNNAANAMEMVDLGEESINDAANAELKSSEEVNLGDLNDVEVENTQPDQAANIKQQLEYVGVSRATDTVTIISNNVKKEGSPLHLDKNIKDNTINSSNSRSENKYSKENGTEEYKTTDEFRRVQEASRKLSQEQISRMRERLSEDDKRRLGGLLGRQLDTARNGGRYNLRTSLTYTKKNGKVSTFNIGDVDPQLFHDIFEIVRTYLKNGELIDLHDDYSDAKCFITSDGLAGFAIEPDGNLVSVFSLNPKENGGFFYAIKDMVREEGATHLDAYASDKQPLQEIYSKTLGFHTAATMDYNMEYDHDDIAKNHDNPQVVFMVNHEVAEPKHFDKDSYDAAQQYQLQQLKESETEVTNPSFPEGQTQKVSLPGYEYFNELYDETPVDAAWKIPYLKELDAQLSMENSFEENQNIINQMDTVLQATSEKEYLQESKDSQKKFVEKNLDEYDKLNKQIDTLLNGDEDLEELEIPLSASEIRHTAELVADVISDYITELQKEEGIAEKIYPTLNTDVDFQTASRKQIVEAVNINNLITRARDLFNIEITRPDDMDIASQSLIIYRNWDAIMYLAADIFAMNEGFGITKDYSRGNFTTTEDSKVDFDNFNDYSNDQDIAAEEGEKDEQEHWQVESRTIDVLNSMSALVRLGLHECYLLDAEGNKVYSKWGIAERVNPRESVNSILRWTQGALSLDDMIKRLSDKQKQNPWLSQLIERLSDKSGKETDFQSQFYGVFSKHFQLYSIVLLEDGKYYSMTVNSHPALSEAMKSISALFKIGEHPLFGNNGKINSKLLGSDQTIGKNSEFNLHKALTELREIDKAIKEGRTPDDTMTKNAIDNILGTCRVLGYTISEDMLDEVVNPEKIKKITDTLGFIVNDLDKALQAQNKGTLKEYDPFKFGGEYSIGGSMRNFLTPITDKLEDTAVNAFYDSGKMYQSYITPSFMTKLMNKFRQEGQAFEDFILDEYGSSEWFKFNVGDDDIYRGWRNEWLRLLAGTESARKVFDHKVELNFNKHNYMRNMSDAEYTLSLITEYFSEPESRKETMVPAWFRVPMQSNKPSSEFIKFYSYRGEGYKNSIVYGLHNMFLQELSRIQTVRMRNMDKKDAGFIKNFDTNGRRFNFLPVLNNYLENTADKIAKRDTLRNEDNTVSSDNSRLASLLQKKVEGEVALTAEEEAELGKLADRVIRQHMEDRVQSILNNWENNGILEAAKSIKGIYPSELKDEEAADWVRKQVENYLWNDAFASKNILQLTLTDIAFYKDTEDLQKRLAQLHAPGVRGNIYATDYNGNRVSDGKYRTFILQDFDSFKSNIIANIAEVFDRRIAAAPENQKAQMMALKESLVGKDGKYTKINVTDAQGYSSPSSYRKKAFIFGRWSRQAEDIYQKLQKGEYNYTDLETAFQPLKPFVYSKLTKDMGVANAPIHSMEVPFQAKNAEYLLIMADAILKGEKLSRPNLLRAVYRVMEDSEKLNPTKGIDTVQFESAIKSGLQGKMNIFQFRDMEGGEEAAYTYMMNQIFKEETGATGERVYRNYNTDTFVHEASYEDYCLQQEVPEHFKEHSQAHGSQIRMITPSDLDLYTTDEKGNQVDNFYEWTEPDGTHRKVKADEFRKEYEKIIADNIEESINNLAAELHFNSNDKKEQNIALSKILQREIMSSPRYGIDLLQACSIDKETGEFRIPKGDPIQAKRIEQLINSIIKNRVNKQKIAGGPIVQVSNFGTSTQLHIRFNDKQGNLMPLEEEYNASEHDNLSYKEFIRRNQGGIAYFEVFAPIWSNELFDKFANANGTINVDAINAVDPELLKMVSYRIPTEDKYSCAPMKVIGFMPREAGDAIMLPYELTEIDDSDFDVDKRYVMRKDIPIKTRKRSEIEKELFARASESYKKAHDGKTNNTWVGDQVRMFMDNPQKMKGTDKLMKWLYSQYQSIAYYTDAPTSGRTYRDNKIIDMTYAVLTNQMTADKILNPGGFDAPKKMGYMVAAYKNPANKGIKWSDLQKMSIDELKDLSYTDKDLTFADTQVQFYKQNSAAASLIGVFAVNKVAHATLESNDIFLDVSEICGDKPFTIAGTTFGIRMQIDKKYDNEGTLIGKTLGSLVSASADAVKDPILNLMNINMTTAGMLNTMLRLGMTFEDAALFLSQDIIERTLNKFNRENLTNYESLSNIIEKWLTEYREKNNINDDSLINTEELTKEELVEGLTSEEHEATDYKVLLAFQKIRQLVDAMRKPTYATRFNSISSAVGPLIVDNLIIEHKMEAFLDANTENGTHFYTSDDVPVDIDDIFFDHPVLKQFARTVDIAKAMFSDMPTGSTGFRNLMKELPVDISDKMYNDKKLLDQFSNFYQSYLLVQSGLINPTELKDYINEFPKVFDEVKDNYPNNTLIQAIRMNVSKKTGRPYLMINITGMDEQRKEELRSAWIDLHKEDPELSQMLFNYSFFRAGIGFSPKTFMSLVPTYVKEKLKSKDGNASYVDTYRRFPDVANNLVIDQFIRNNWTNNKLVPIKGGKDTHYNIDVKHNRLTVYRPEEIADLAGISYMKTKMNNNTYLWHLTSDKGEELVFELMKPLGNNGEYLEMSTEKIKTPISEVSDVTNKASDTLDVQQNTSELKEKSVQEESVEEVSNKNLVPNIEVEDKVTEIVNLLMMQNPKFTNESALKKFEEIKDHPEIFKGFLQNVFKHKGLSLNVEEAIKEFKKYC
nr:MAG TPA: ATP dependent DNA helicase [Caudoviricetes sp.]